MMPGQMNDEEMQYVPIPGRTYSLFGPNDTTETYYKLIGQLADECVRKYQSGEALLQKLRKTSPKKRLLRRARAGSGDPELVSLLGTICPPLSEFTVYLQHHLDELPVLKLRDRRLRTTEEQYHMYMLEIELVNRIDMNAFRECAKKIAFLPYCLQDFSGSCKSSMGDIDFVCRRCSTKCYINRVSSFLKENDISPYIWKTGKLKRLKKLPKDGGRLGGLGIACVVELVVGMRSCAPLDIPVVGLPLDANRCKRWTGTFYPNSVNLSRLERLLH